MITGRFDKDHDQSIEKKVCKRDFFHLIKQLLTSSSLVQLLSNKEISELVTEFLAIDMGDDKNIETYDKIEKNGLELLKNILIKAQWSHNKIPNRFVPVIAPLFFIIGICQFAQGKNTEAKISFEEAYYHLGKDSLDFESIIVLLILYILSKNPSLETLFKMKSLLPVLSNLRQNIELNHNPSLIKLFDYFDKISVPDVTNQGEFNVLDGIFATYKTFHTQAEAEEIENSQKIILASPYFKHLESTEKLIFYTHLIACKIGVLAKSTAYLTGIIKQTSLIKYYNEIIALILEAHQHISFPELIDGIYEKLNEDNETLIEIYSQINYFKEILAQLQNNHAQYHALSINAKIDYCFASTSIQTREPFYGYTLSNEEFVEESIKLAVPILLKLCNAVSQDKKEACRLFIEQFKEFSAHKSTLYYDCVKYIKKLFQEENSFLLITKKHGPILEILYYIASLSMIGIADENIELSETNLNEGLYHASLSNSELKNLYYIARLYLRLISDSDDKFYAALADLNQITNIKNTQNNLFKKIITDLDQYTKIFSYLNVKNLDAIDQVIVNIKDYVLNDSALPIEDLQDQFKMFGKEIHLLQKMEYHFWMTLYYFKAYNKLKKNKNDNDRNDSENLINERFLLSHLTSTLAKTPNLIGTLLGFIKVLSTIYKSDDKKYVELFYYFTQEIQYESLVFKQNIERYCSQSIEGTVCKNDFINLIKELSKPYLIELSSDTHLSKIIKEFLNITDLNKNIENYKNVEEQTSKLLKGILVKEKYPHHKKTNKLTPLIGALFFIIGACQLAQGKDIAAKISFEEAYRYLEGFNLEFESIIALSTLYVPFKNPSLEILLKAKKELPRLLSLKKNNTVNEKPLINKLFNYFDNKPAPEVINKAAFNKINNILQDWKNEDEDEELRIYHQSYEEQLLISPYLKYLEYDEIENLYTSVIISKIRELLEFKKSSNDIPIENYKNIIKLIIEAHKYLEFPALIENILNKIIENNDTDNNKYFKIVELKIILGKLKSNYPEYYTWSVNSQIDHHLSCFDLREKLKREPFCIKINANNKTIATLSNKQFVEESSKLAKPILLELCNAVSAQHQNYCRSLINQFSKNAINENEYKKIYDACIAYIDKLLQKSTFSNVSNKHGPVLEILYYIAGLSSVMMSDNVKNFKITEKNLNEGLYYALLSDSKIKNFYYLARAVLRLNDNSCDDAKIYGARDDLNQIPNNFKNNKSKTANLIQSIIYNLDIYTKKYPSTNLKRHPEVDKVLDDIKDSILQDRELNIVDLQDRFESFDKKIIHPSQNIDYHFWITIFYFKSYNQLIEDKKDQLNFDNEKFLLKNDYEKCLLDYLNATLSETPVLINTLLKFKDTLSEIYKPNDKKYIKLFYDVTQKIEDSKNDSNRLYSSLVFKQIVYKYCKITESDKQQSIKQDQNHSLVNDHFSNQSKFSDVTLASSYVVNTIYQNNEQCIFTAENIVQESKNSKKEKNSTNEDCISVQKNKQGKARKNKEEDEKRIAAEEVKRQEDEKRIAAEEAKRQEDEKRIAAQEAKRLEEAKKIAAEEAKRQEVTKRIAATQERRKAHEAKILADKQRKDENRKLHDARVLADKQRKEEKKIAAEEAKHQEEEKRIAAKEAKRQEEAKKIAAEEAKRQEEEKRIAAEEAKRQEEEKRIAAEEAKRQEEESLKQEEAHQIAVSNKYLEQFFYDECSELRELNDFVNQQSSSIIFKGSFVVQWQLGETIDIGDIDASIEFTASNLSELINGLNSMGFVLEKTNNNNYFNFKKKLKSGYIFDISLTNNKSYKEPDFIRITSGEAKLKPNLSLALLDNEEFVRICKNREMELGIITPNTTFCMFRLYKCIKRYGSIIKITNFEETLDNFMNLYSGSDNNIHPNAIYLELHAFHKHNILNVQDSITYLNVIFRIILISKGLPEDIVNEVTQYFILCKDFLNVQNKVAFINQVDLIILLYFGQYFKIYNGSNIHFIQSEIRNLASLNSQDRCTMNLDCELLLSQLLECRQQQIHSFVPSQHVYSQPRDAYSGRANVNPQPRYQYPQPVNIYPSTSGQVNVYINPLPQQGNVYPQQMSSQTAPPVGSTLSINPRFAGSGFGAFSKKNSNRGTTPPYDSSQKEKSSTAKNITTTNSKFK